MIQKENNVKATPMTKIINIADLQDPNDSHGRTYRQINNQRAHSFPLGTLVETDIELSSNSTPALVDLKGRCRLYVVAHSRDCDGTPLYSLSDIPVLYPTGDKFSREALVYKALATLVQHGYSEESLVVVAQERIYATMAEYFSA